MGRALVRPWSGLEVDDGPHLSRTRRVAWTAPDEHSAHVSRRMRSARTRQRTRAQSRMVRAQESAQERASAVRDPSRRPCPTPPSSLPAATRSIQARSHTHSTACPRPSHPTRGSFPSHCPADGAATATALACLSCPLPTLPIPTTHTHTHTHTTTPSARHTPTQARVGVLRAQGQWAVRGPWGPRDTGQAASIIHIDTGES